MVVVSGWNESGEGVGNWVGVCAQSKVALCGAEETTKTEQGIGQHKEMVKVSWWKDCGKGEVGN